MTLTGVDEMNFSQKFEEKWKVCIINSKKKTTK